MLKMSKLIVGNDLLCCQNVTHINHFYANQLLENVCFVIYQPRVQIAQHFRCLAPCLKVIATINEKYSFRHSSANIKDNCT